MRIKYFVISGEIVKFVRYSIDNMDRSNSYKLTVLIPTLKSRTPKLGLLLDELDHQIQGRAVQWLTIGDNKSMTVGEKRNFLKSMAKGEFVCFVDDDDVIEHNYIDTILAAIGSHPDKKVIHFKGRQTTDGRTDAPFKYGRRYGRNFKKTEDGTRWKVMLPDHLCVWRRDMMELEDFPHKQLGEDHDWARAMTLHYEDSDELFIDEYLYFYHFSRQETECRR